MVLNGASLRSTPEFGVQDDSDNGKDGNTNERQPDTTGPAVRHKVAWKGISDQTRNNLSMLH